MDDPLQALRQPHGTQEVEGAQAVAGVGEVQQGARDDQEVDGWMWMQVKEEERRDVAYSSVDRKLSWVFEE